MIEVTQNKYGHIEIENGEREAYIQHDVDCQSIKDMLTPDETADIEEGWTVKIDPSEPRAMCFGDLCR